MLPLDSAALDHALDGTWADALRHDAFGLYEKLDLPSSREEVWRYVDLDLNLAAFGLPDMPGEPLGADTALRDAIGEVAGAAAVIDGSPVRVDPAGSPAVFSSLRRAAVDYEHLLAPVHGKGIPPDLDKFSAAHYAFGGDGVFLHVPAGAAVARPFYVELEGVTPGAATFPRVTIVLEDDAEASIVIACRTPRDGQFLVVPHFEMFVGDRARLRASIVQNWSYETKAIAQARAIAGRDATVRLSEVGLGGDLARLHLVVDLEGQGSSAEILGAYFGEDDQTLDYRYFMNHIGPNTTSEMFLKGAVEDEALSVFTGMIRIENSAQRTNAHQTNRNLILSEGASAQSVPNLEILANDVRCGHGSTVGPLDEEQRYYLMSRGLEAPRADRLQVRGFFEEALARFPQPGIDEPVRQWINAKYIAAQEEGRV